VKSSRKFRWEKKPKEEAMKLIHLLALICALVYFLPLRIVSVLTERAISSRREAGWDSRAGDQFALAAANAGALRQAQIYSAYPGPARLVVDGLRLVGVR
jgi:hypothetical protein